MKDEDIDDLISEYDLDDFDSLDDDSGVPKKKNKKEGTSPIFKVLAGLFVAAIIGTILYSSNSNDNTREAQVTETKTSEAESNERAELQLVNTEQVLWADEMCNYFSYNEWGDSLHKMPTYDEAKKPKTVRDEMSDLLGRNAYRVNYRANKMKELPNIVYDSALNNQEFTTVIDNNKKLGDTPDEKVVNISQSLSLAFENYARSLSDMKKDLDSIADYDANGLRNAVNRVNNGFETINQQLGNEVTEALQETNFDNVVTIKKASENESCAGNFADFTNASDEVQKILDDQALISDYVLEKRCQNFVSNTSNVTQLSDDLKNNIELCNNVLSRVSVDETNEIFAQGVDTKDSERATPNIDLGLLADTQEENTTEPSETTADDSEDNNKK